MKKRHTNIPASYLVVIKENKILLLKRFNTWYEDGKYSMIAWHVDPWESFTQCIIREAKEEAWIEVKYEHLEVIHIMHRYIKQERVDTFFIAKKRKGEITNKEPNKCSELSWFDLDNIPENTIPYIKTVIEKIKKNIFYSEYWWNNE